MSEDKKRDWSLTLLNKDIGLAKEGRQLYQALQIIDWNLVNRGCGHWGIVDENGNEQNLELYGRGSGDCRLTVDKPHNYDPVICFHLQYCNVEILDGATIAVRPNGSDKGVFILFTNTDMNRLDKGKVAQRLLELKEDWVNAEEVARHAGVLD